MSTSTFTFDGLTIELQQTTRSIDGLVHFPEAFKRSSVAIACRVAGEQTDATQPASGDRPGRRERAVHAYRDATAADPGAKRGPIAKRVAAASGCSVRTLQLWDRAHSLKGAAGLADKSDGIAAISGDDPLLGDAIRVCAYWCFRIANLDVIRSGDVSLALGIVRSAGLNDALGVIDYYCEYDTDRERYHFIRFPKWARYDFEKWLHRAQNDVDRKKARKVARDESRHRLTSKPKARIAPDQKTRHRDVVSRAGRTRPDAVLATWSTIWV